MRVDMVQERTRFYTAMRMALCLRVPRVDVARRACAAMPALRIEVSARRDDDHDEIIERHVTVDMRTCAAVDMASAVTHSGARCAGCHYALICRHAYFSRAAAARLNIMAPNGLPCHMLPRRFICLASITPLRFSLMLRLYALILRHTMS